MRISTFRVANYKSFYSSREIRLEPGFNVIVGQNNAGKTALVEAMSLDLGILHPHRSRKTIPHPAALPNLRTQVTICFDFAAEEFGKAVAREVAPTIYVPAGSYGTDPAYRVNQFRGLVAQGPTIEVKYDLEAQDVSGSGSTIRATGSLVGYDPGVETGAYIRFDVDPDSGEFGYVPGVYTPDEPLRSAFARGLAEVCMRRLYGFKAVRFGIDEYPIGPVRDLQPDASNLVQVLHLLYGENQSRWRRYFNDVHTVLPQIKGITFTPSTSTISGTIRALLWNIDQETERADLAVSLSESGTGVGQVLAILYVAFASEEPRTIVIDEPQSFLHPGAVRKLFEILRGYPQHQYVITTHSPNAVTAADPNALFLVHKEEEESMIEQLDVGEARDQARFLREAGASLSDVFGADNVLWVEGATEEECFPMILSEVARRPLLGTKILGVLSTGDLEGKRSRDAYRLYERLSEGGGLLPPTVGFIFDKEERSEKDRNDLVRESGGLVSFTKRRMYENYLLNAEAIAAVVSDVGSSHDVGGAIEPAAVEEWIDEHGLDGGRHFSGDGAVSETSLLKQDAWLERVHGARVLEDLFCTLSENRVAYDKVGHGVALTRWLCEHAPEDLEEIAELIEKHHPSH